MGRERSRRGKTGGKEGSSGRSSDREEDTSENCSSSDSNSSEGSSTGEGSRSSSEDSHGSTSNGADNRVDRIDGGSRTRNDRVTHEKRNDRTRNMEDARSEVNPNAPKITDGQEAAMKPRGKAESDVTRRGEDSHPDLHNRENIIEHSSAAPALTADPSRSDPSVTGDMVNLLPVAPLPQSPRKECESKETDVARRSPKRNGQSSSQSKSCTRSGWKGQSRTKKPNGERNKSLTNQRLISKKGQTTMEVDPEDAIGDRVKHVGRGSKKVEPAGEQKAGKRSTKQPKSSSRAKGPQSKSGKKENKRESQDAPEAAEGSRVTWEWICTSQIPTMKHVPKGIRREWGEILDFGMKRVIDEPMMEANWRLLMALPKLCLRTPPRGGRKKKGPSPRMCEWTLRLLLKARRGDWTELWEEAAAAGKKMQNKQRRTVADEKQRQAERLRKRVTELVSEGQYRRACTTLRSEGVWKLDNEIKKQLQDKHPQGEGWKKAEQVEGVAEESQMNEDEGEQEFRVTFSERQVEKALKSFPKGTASGGSEGRAQHWLDALDGTVGDGRK